MEKVTTTQTDKYQDDLDGIRYDYSVNSDGTGKVTSIDFSATLTKTQLRIASGCAEQNTYRFAALTEYGVQHRETLEAAVNKAVNELYYSKNDA